jgi:hypothetical protein
LGESPPGGALYAHLYIIETPPKAALFPDITLIFCRPFLPANRKKPRFLVTEA